MTYSHGIFVLFLFKGSFRSLFLKENEENKGGIKLFILTVLYSGRPFPCPSIISFTHAFILPY